MLRKILNKITYGAKKAISFVSERVSLITRKASPILANSRAEGYVDSGVRILISVVIGALLLAGLYSLFDDTIMPTVSQKIQNLFSYTG